MYFAILGPVEVGGDHGRCEPAFPMSRQVLSLLLVHANQVVSMDSLMEELWDTSPPKLARKTVQTHIYHVRKALRNGAESTAHVDTAPRGYRIRLDKGQLDLWRFEELCATARAAISAGRLAAASAAYREALVLWRGPAFSSVTTGSLLSAQRARLEDLRMGALEQRIEVDMELGRHRELLSELKALTFQHPLNEVVTGQLMRAATRSGHRQAALDAYHRLRTAMVDQLGLEPSAGIKELQQDILQEGLLPEPRSVAAAHEVVRLRPPAELPPKAADFTGREERLAEIVTAADSPGEDAVDQTAVRVVVVSGGVGTGKTATAVEAAYRLRPRYPGGQLFATLHRPDGTPVSPQEALVSLLLSSGQSRRHLPEAVEDLARLFRSWTAERRLLVVLDDAHSLEQVRPLLPNSPDCAVVITSRWRLEGLPGAVTHVPLKGMRPNEAVTLLAAVAGSDRITREWAAAEELVRLYNGLPLAVRALGQRLSARQDLTVRDLLSRAQQDSKRLMVLQGPGTDAPARIGRAHLRLPAAERELLALLCRLPRPVGESELVRAMDGSDVPPGQFNCLIESLVAASFVELRMCHRGPTFTVPDLSRLALSADTRLTCQSPPRIAPGAAA
ncbi:BTAD domain-containing putative transcriptional regulator [Streptomyces sp. NPDC039022]|uniref:AfsR/SARP family transcriptional regulator n=1 Tax=Streptomyces sp. NPDC039022 TaxID=3157091 RepID=UPI00340C3CD9